VNISINHVLVGDEEIQIVAQKWLGRKERRTIPMPGMKKVRVVESRRAEGENKNALLEKCYKALGCHLAVMVLYVVLSLEVLSLLEFA